MEFFIEKKNKDSNIIQEVGFKKGEIVQIYRPKNYTGPTLNIFHYKGYKVEILENQRYNTDEIKVYILGQNVSRYLKIDKSFLKRI
jgi:hypothetical protein